MNEKKNGSIPEYKQVFIKQVLGKFLFRPPDKAAFKKCTTATLTHTSQTDIDANNLLLFIRKKQNPHEQYIIENRRKTTLAMNWRQSPLRQPALGTCSTVALPSDTSVSTVARRARMAVKLCTRHGNEVTEIAAKKGRSCPVQA